jgi:hypothetical protein
MLLLRPSDLLRLLKLSGDSERTFRAPLLPPDVRVADTFFDEARETFVLVLESEWFDPIAVTQSKTGVWRGAWNELTVEFEGDDDIPDAWETIPPPPEARWEAYFLRPDEVLQLLVRSESMAPPPLPPDSRLRGAHYDAERGAVALFLESGFFAPASQLRDAEGVRLTLPERWWGTAGSAS